jgi:2-isopropylmalate synthase
MSESQPVRLYDTTLRDGTQREGLVLSLADKLKIAQRLDSAGFPYIEGGWPGSNPKDQEFFAAARDMTWRNARIAAFGSTRHRANRPADDPNLQALVAAETPVCTIFGKSWLLHVRDVLGATPEENVAMVGDSVAFLRAAGREVVYDAEHFFDGYKSDADYALATLRAAHDAGATSLVMCDTNGGTLTEELSSIVRDVIGRLELDTTYGIHVHDDAGLAVANSLAAVAAGVRHVQGTINGYGERCGNANIVTIWANLGLKLGLPTVPPAGDLTGLAELSRFVAEVANIAPDAHQPYVGTSAFAHKGGVHGAATARVRDAYQHVSPELVGNETRLVVSELGGRANTQWRAEQLGHRLEGVVDPRALSQLIKQLESEGASFEGADASFELLIRRHQPDYQPPFRVIDFTVLVEQRGDLGRRQDELRAEATVKVQVDGEVLHTAADGNGPVNALDQALRKALGAFYPQLDAVHLVDYKVRILDGDAATAARTRVLIESSGGDGTWSTVGSDTNIIAASAKALCDSLEYAIWKTGAELRRRDERHFTTDASRSGNGRGARGTAHANSPSRTPRKRGAARAARTTVTGR